MVRLSRLLPIRRGTAAAIAVAAVALAAASWTAYREMAVRTADEPPVVKSQDISRITALVAARERLEYLQIARPRSDAPLYVFKFRDSPEIHVVRVPSTSHEGIEREILLRHDVPYAIASPEFLSANAALLSDGFVREWGVTAGTFLLRNAVGILLLVMLVYLLKNGMPGMTNKVTMLRPERLKGSLDDLVGMDDVKAEVAHLEQMLRDRGLYRTHGIDRPFNVMLTGPAGTGKTKLAGYLAKRLGVPLIQASAAALETGLVGGGAKTLTAIHRKACAQGACVVFLDEAQGLFMPRGRGDKKWEDDTANTLLGLLDGVRSEAGAGVIWIVASNFDDVSIEMDDAMLRRFPVKINFRLPNRAERRELMHVFLSRKDPRHVDWTRVDLDRVADATANLSPALIETVAERASLISIQEDVRIDTDVLLRAYERSTIGLTDRAASADKDRQRERISVHELGHFFMQIDPLLRQGLALEEVKARCGLLKISTESVSRLGALGFVLSAPEEAGLRTLEELEQDVCALYGGVAAEELFYGERGISVGSRNDIRKATALLKLMVSELSMYSRAKLDHTQLQQDGAHETLQAVEAKADQLYRDTLARLAPYRDRIDALKTTLLERYVLGKDELFALLAELQDRAVGGDASVAAPVAAPAPVASPAPSPKPSQSVPPGTSDERRSAIAA
jgi:cell division protease FtsH